MDKGYAETIASDIMQMLESAKGSDLDLNSGFQNDAFTAENFHSATCSIPATCC